MSDLLRILAILGLVAANAFFVGEYAVVTARRSRLAQRVEAGSRGAAAALRLMDDPVRVISTVQIGITAIGILTGAIGEPLVRTSSAATCPRGCRSSSRSRSSRTSPSCSANARHPASRSRATDACGARVRGARTPAADRRQRDNRRRRADRPRGRGSAHRRTARRRPLTDNADPAPPCEANSSIRARPAHSSTATNTGWRPVCQVGVVEVAHRRFCVGVWSAGWVAVRQAGRDARSG